MLRGRFTIALAVLSFTAHARLEVPDQQKAAEKLASKILKLSQDLDLKEVKYKESKGGPGGGGKETNANDGNSFTSNTTYHSYVWDYCRKWAGRFCEEWVQPYVSLHGSGGDKSPLEGDIYTAWKDSKRDPASASDKGNYAIWDFEANGSFLKADGTLDRKAITKWKVTNDVRGKAEKVGAETARRQLAMIASDPQKAKNGKLATSPEAKRMMAGRWTKMYRNRMTSIVAETAAMQPGIEFALGEDIPDCDSYLNEMRKNMDRNQIDPKIDPQAVLSRETRFKEIENRYSLCQQARKSSVYEGNKQAKGDTLEAGAPEEEWADAALARANIAAIDYVGVDPSEMGMAGRMQIDPEDKAAAIAVTDEDGETKIKKTSNASQLASYNFMLENAAVGYKEAAQRSYFARDRSEEVLKHKIEKGSINAVKLNDLTPAQAQDLEEGGYPNSAKNDDPGDNLELNVTQIIGK